MTVLVRIPAMEADRFRGGDVLPAHRHENAYAAIILTGRYIECGLDGRYDCGPGHIVIHPTYHAHANEFGEGDCEVCNIPLPAGPADETGYGVYATPATDELIRLAEASKHDAALALLEEATPQAPIAPPQWLDEFLALLFCGWRIEAAATACRVSVPHASRVCRRWLGSPPTDIRREAQIRRAIQELRDGASIAETAQLCGFADQPHLTRALKSATGRTPATFRAA